MAIRSLNRFLRLRSVLIKIRNFYLKRVRGIILGEDVRISLSSRLISRERGGISIGSFTLVSFKTLIYTYDPASKCDLPIRIGKNCFIGGGSCILPGVTIGDECIVAAGAVVSSSVASRTIVSGNPAAVLRERIVVGPFGRMPNADANKLLYWK
jgi:acetyltransferase-like isoleucine patch superfamily enzyme